MSGKFQSLKAMNEVRHMDDLLNSMRNRGEIPQTTHFQHVICGCGVDGCVFQSDWAKHETPLPVPPEPKKKKK